MNCWRRKGCVYNCNTESYLKCIKKGYSVEQCARDYYTEDAEKEIKRLKTREKKLEESIDIYKEALDIKEQLNEGLRQQLNKESQILQRLEENND